MLPGKKDKMNVDRTGCRYGHRSRRGMKISCKWEMGDGEEEDFALFSFALILI